uniref:LRAT domain-containing protein n=2 Tax=Leptobrachium leishanense TaxID=445787 RepID=A0A8C5WLW4_9ANUR
MPLVGPDPKPGDLIEYQRLGYQHWGIYVGDGFVVHLTDQDGFSSISSAFGASAVVRKDRMERVAAGCYYKVNNKYDGKRTPLPIRKVVHAALDKVGETLNYSLTSENCEHFVTELRYGESFSDQVDNAKMYAVGGTIGLALAAGLAVAFSSTRNRHQK